MAKTNILRLNEYCLFKILDYIKINCESNRRSNRLAIIYYADLISFALSCERFLDVFWHWNADLYVLLEIEKTYLSESSDVVVDFAKHSKRLQKSTQKDKDTFWKMYIDALESNTKLCSIKLSCISDTYYSDHGEIFDILIRAIQSKGSITSLTIDMEGYSLDSLHEFRNLEHLYLNVKINAMELTEYCRENPNLLSLQFMNNEIYGKLSDIVPYCNNLNELAFKVKSEFHDTEYVPLAKLPKLSDLRIEGEHEIGSLKTLIKALAIKEPKTLSNFKIDESPIDCEEIAEVFKIQSLQECKFNGIKDIHSIIFDPNLAQLTLSFTQEIDATEFADLGHLINFTSLLIVGKHLSGTLQALFKTIALQKSPKLKQLQFRSNHWFNKDFDIHDYINNIELRSSPIPFAILNNEEIIEIFKISSLRVLDCTMGDTRPIEYPSQLPQLEKLYIAKVEGGSLVNLFHALALQKSSSLTKLYITGIPLSCKEIVEIAKIISLTDLECGFSDLKSIDFLAQLKQLDVLIIISKHNLKEVSEAVVNLFVACNGNLNVFCANNSINMNKHLRALTLTMSENINAADFEPLSNIPSLPNLLIYGRHQLNSLTPLLKAFASKPSTVLQELTIEMDPISHNEVSQVAQIKTLRHLEAGFSDPQSIKLLRHLPNLESLIINDQNDMHVIAEGVLSVLLGGANEVTVFRFGREITFNKSLGKLTISNVAYTNEVFDAQEYAMLAELPQLHTVHIRGEHKIGSFKCLFKALAAKKWATLQDLVIEARSSVMEHPPTITINFKETSELAQIQSLRTLKCGFADDKSIELLAQLTELQELVITTHPEGSLMHLFRALSSRELSNLQCISIEGRSLTSEETIKVSSITSLRKLECGIADGQNTKLLTQLNKLEELTIKSHRGGLLLDFEIFALGGSKVLQSLNIANIPISYEETMALIGIKSLRRLHCQFTDMRSTELLVHLPELKKLNIQLSNSDTEGIEALAQLSKLADLEITSPKVGSLADLFNELSLRMEPTLHRLVITNNDIDLEEIKEISKLNSIRRLQCGLIEEESFQYVMHLTNLEVLEITSYHNFEDISQYLLRILQVCCKLKTINFHYGSRFVSLEFVNESLRILKAVRNAKVQEPLQLRIPFFGGLTPEQIAIADDEYLIVSRFKKAA